MQREGDGYIFEPPGSQRRDRRKIEKLQGYGYMCYQGKQQNDAPMRAARLSLQRDLLFNDRVQRCHEPPSVFLFSPVMLPPSSYF
jgi:hypothetical protein